MDKNGKNKSGLSLFEIIELVWCWVNKFKVEQTEKITGRGHHTVSDWFNLCRDLVVEQFKKRGKMGGKGLIVQIDESIFQGKLSTTEEDFALEIVNLLIMKILMVILPILPRIILTKKIITMIILIMAAEFKDLGC